MCGLLYGQLDLNKAVLKEQEPCQHIHQSKAFYDFKVCSGEYQEDERSLPCRFLRGSRCPETRAGVGGDSGAEESLWTRSTGTQVTTPPHPQWPLCLQDWAKDKRTQTEVPEGQTRVSYLKKAHENDLQSWVKLDCESV